MQIEDIEEILACMKDSDRYINESRKNRLMVRMKNELVRRGLKQYDEQPSQTEVAS